MHCDKCNGARFCTCDEGAAGQDVPSIELLDDVLCQMETITMDIPTIGDFAESGRYTWPERWAELKTRIEEMKSSNDKNELPSN